MLHRFSNARNILVEQYVIFRSFLHRLWTRIFASSTYPIIEAEAISGLIEQQKPAQEIPLIPKEHEEHPCEAYMDLKMRYRDLGHFYAIAETMGRDYLTAMPEYASDRRLEQISFLHQRMHESLQDNAIHNKFTQAQQHQKSAPHLWDEWDTANLREMTCYYNHHTCVPADIFAQQAQLSYNGRRVHRDCLKNNDWKTAREFLQQVVDLTRKIAEIRCDTNGALPTSSDISRPSSPYEACLQTHIPGIDLSCIENWYADLEAKIKPMIPKIMDKQSRQGDVIPLSGSYSSQSQMWLNRCLLEAIGFDFRRGGLYETGHNPVEGGTPEDTRLVIKTVDNANFLDSLKSALHEGGHGLYIQGLPRNTWRYQPVAQDLGAAVHESQALLIEMIIGRTLEFFTYISPRLEGLYHHLRDPALTPENLYRLKTRVKPSVMRKSADEVTYFFHVMMRMRLEKRLIEGDLDVKDIPEAWNEEMQDVLGVLPETHKDGALQDVHWFVGKFGYFPSYTIGHMIAAQLHEKINTIIPDLKMRIIKGEFKDITAWLNTNIHQHGRLFSAQELIKQATGKAISPTPLVHHLENRYLKSTV